MQETVAFQTPWRHKAAMKQLIPVFIALFFFTAACSKSMDYHGKYIFDTDSFRVSLLNQANTELQNVPQKHIDLFIESLKDYEVQISKTAASLKMGSIKIEGDLLKVAESPKEIRFIMTPSSPLLKDKQLHFIVQKNRLIVDPKKGENERMYFVKAK